LLPKNPLPVLGKFWNISYILYIPGCLTVAARIHVSYSPPLMFSNQKFSVKYSS